MACGTLPEEDSTAWYLYESTPVEVVLLLLLLAVVADVRTLR